MAWQDAQRPLLNKRCNQFDMVLQFYCIEFLSECAINENNLDEISWKRLRYYFNSLNGARYIKRQIHLDSGYTSSMLTINERLLQIKKTITTTKNIDAKLWSFFSWVVNNALWTLARRIARKIRTLKMARQENGIMYMKTRYIQVT